MSKTVAETIREITRRHILEDNGTVMGQCLSAVGWVGGTVPEMKHPNLIELSMDDTSNTGFAVGHALAGRRPIQIIRYQGFEWINASFLVNYAAKSKDLWGIPCPIFIRAIAMEGGIGPVAGSAHHGMIARMPGIKVYAPMTPHEIDMGWRYFMDHDDPLYVSEHRRSFPIDYEMPDIIHKSAELTIYAISATRLDAITAVELLALEGININLIHLTMLKPFIVDEEILKPLETSLAGGLVLDDDFVGGISKSIAFDIMQKSHKKVRALGLEERSAGFAAHLDNLPPSPEKIVNSIKKIIAR